MKSALTDLAAMSQEARERALRHAMALELAEKSDRDELWSTAANLAMDAEGAAAMTIPPRPLLYSTPGVARPAWQGPFPGLHRLLQIGPYTR